MMSGGGMYLSIIGSSSSFTYFYTGAYLYDSCGSAQMASAAAADYISKRSAAVETCSNSTQYWPGTCSSRQQTKGFLAVLLK